MNWRGGIGSRRLRSPEIKSRLYDHRVESFFLFKLKGIIGTKRIEGRDLVVGDGNQGSPRPDLRKLNA